jgi:hypothetical protein
MYSRPQWQARIFKINAYWELVLALKRLLEAGADTSIGAPALSCDSTEPVMSVSVLT